MVCTYKQNHLPVRMHPYSKDCRYFDLDEKEYWEILRAKRATKD